MSWYRAGTVSVTNGSTSVSLTGGNALANISPGDGFIGPDGRSYEVSLIGGAGSFTLATNYAGTTASGQTYQIIPVADYLQLRDALVQINALITDYQTIALNAGTGKFAAGSAASPGVRGIGQEGTGLVWNGDGTLSISVGGTIVATFSTAGSSAITFADGTVGAPGIRFGADLDTGLWRSGANSLDVVTGGISAMRFTASQQTLVADGTVTNPAVGFITDLNTGMYRAGADTLGFTTGGVERVRITSAGNFGIGITPTALMHIRGGGVGATQLRLDSSATQPNVAFYNGDANVNNRNWAIVAGHTAFGDLTFRISNAQGGDPLAAGANTFRILTGPIYEMTVGGGGRLFVEQAGSTSVKLRSSATMQYDVASASSHQFMVNGDPIAQIGPANAGFGTSSPTSRLHVLSTAGDTLRIDSTKARGAGGGFISFADTTGRKSYVGYGAANDGFYTINDLNAPLYFGTNGITRWQIDTSGHFLPTSDNSYDVGSASFRGRVAYFGTGAINTSDENQKFDIGEIPDEWLDAWADVQWSRYKFVGGHRWHVGLVAQRVHAAFAAHGIDAFEIGLCCRDDIAAREAVEAVEAVEGKPAVYDDEGNLLEEEIPAVIGHPAKDAIEAGEIWGLRYDECFAMEAAYQRRVQTQQEERIAALEALLNV